MNRAISLPAQCLTNKNCTIEAAALGHSRPIYVSFVRFGSKAEAEILHFDVRCGPKCDILSSAPNVYLPASIFLVEIDLRYCIAKQKMLQCSGRDVLGGSHGFYKILAEAGGKVR